jgi:PAS domain S-box-containing protein
MNDTLNRKVKGSRDLKDVIVIFSIIILILIIASLTDLFTYLKDITASPDGYKITELMLILILFGFAYGFFFRRRWTEVNDNLKIEGKVIEELNDNVNRLMNTVELSPDAIIVHRDLRILFLNKAAIHLFGAQNEEQLIGTDLMSLIHYAYIEKTRDRIELMTKYMKQVPITDMIIKRLDGSYVDVSAASTPVFYHAIPHVISILRDITERKRAEETRSQLASIVLFSTDAIYGLSLDGSFRSWNPGAESLYGYNENEAIGNPISILMPEGRNDEVRYILHKINGGERIESYETKHQKKDKTIIDVSLTISPIKEASGITVAASAIARDITFKKQVELELRRYAEEIALSNEELYVFSYAASHDLMEPLRTIQSFIKFLNENYKLKLSEEIDEYIRSAEDGVTRMSRLISDFLMYSKIGSEHIAMEPVDCNNVLNRALENLQQAIKQSDTKIRHYKLPTINGNLEQLTLVFQNLISNAIKYQGEKKPIIEISAEKKDADWVFLVKDNGIGIEQWFSERIFVVFQKLHDNKKYPGSGIGLALCKRIIEKHGGKMWFESEASVGTTFFFSLSAIPSKIIEQK